MEQLGSHCTDFDEIWYFNSWIILSMRHFSNKSSRENQGTHFVSSNVFFGNRAVYEITSKIWWSQRGCKWQYGSLLHSGLVRVHARKYTPAFMFPHPHTRTHTEMHTHRPICNTYCFSTASNGSANAPQCYVIRTLPVLFRLNLQQVQILGSRTHCHFY